MPNDNGDSTRSVVPATLTAPQAIVLVTLICIFVGLLVFLLPSRPEYLIRKTALKDPIVAALNNGADLRAVKQIYNNRTPTIEFTFPTAGTHYAISVPLSVVLEDIRADLFLPSADKTLLPKLDAIIAEYSQTNPFDALEAFQRDQFERLREKLGERYISVQAEVIRISDELRQKNLLTDQYLRSSNISFWVSVTGLAFSLAIGGIQIFTWIRTSAFHAGRDARTPRTPNTTKHTD